MFLTIAVQILAVLGPLITEWLKKWLGNRLKKAVAKMEKKYIDGGNPLVQLPNYEVLHREMLQTVRNSLWFWQRKKIAFIEHAMNTVPPVSSGRLSALRTVDMTKLSDLSQSASGNDD